MNKFPYAFIYSFFIISAAFVSFSSEAHAVIKKVNNDIYNQVLEEFVTGGLVDYKGLKNDKRLEKYMEHLSNVNPYILDENEQLAFWINTYNAFTLKLIKDAYPVKSINDLSTGGPVFDPVIKQTVLDKFKFKIDNKKYSLNQIKHQIIRKRFNEPRIHFALVCAAKSCPPLRSEAYQADKLNEQLSDQAFRFLNDPSQNGIDLNNKEIYLSGILKWYMIDSARDKYGLVKYVLPYWPINMRQAVGVDVRSWTIRFVEYDWALNERIW
ncbi:MAG: DUF547 domain-containing protein [Candidatus Omnitrophica bacterium]|nr:DUF547 domain-containing protein [Candidatus Omnitrophota bacterium]